MQKITPFLWFDTQAEQAATFYTSIFKNSRITATTRYGAEGPGPKGQVMTVAFELDGVAFVGLNGGPHFTFTPAVSFVVNCQTQQEVDEVWDKLLEGGAPSQCGWLTDKFGVSWQIVPIALPQLLADPDKATAGRVMQAMLKMQKIDIAALVRAKEGTEA